MPLYAFNCPQCGAEFEVSRKMTEASKPAFCPVDGATGSRIFSAPVTLGRRGDDGGDGGAKDGKDGQSGDKNRDTVPQAPRAGAGRWSHFGHSHGTGTGGHSHGGWGI
jgi:putative FmdB family regulatory protein